MAIPIWLGHYIGLPFKEHGRDRSGLDCWGLVRLVLDEQFGFHVPSYASDYTRTTDSAAISRLIDREAMDWRAIARGQECLGDVIVLRMRGQPMHVGLIAGDGQMLHVERGVNSALERYTAARWSSRIEAIYRYRTYLDDLEYADDQAAE